VSADVKRRSIVGQCRLRAAGSPESPAASDATESVSYAELWHRTEAVARLLRARGCVSGRPIGLCMSPTVTRLASMLAIMGIGAPYVPIDPGFPDGRIRSIVGSAGADTILVDDATVERSASLPYRLVNVSDREADPTGPVDPAGTVDPAGPVDPGTPAVVEPDGSDLAYILYTSGSTGDPKGVAIEHGGVANLFEGLDAVLPTPGEHPDECWLAAASVCFDLSVVELFWPLTRGIPLVLGALDSLAGRSGDGAEFLTGVLMSGRVTHFFVTPSLVQLMLRDRGLAAAIRGLRVLILGGEVVQPELIARLRPVPHVYNAYGPTEATVATTVYECSDRDVEYVPIGRPLRGLDVRVVDEDGRDCPPGVPGELLIAGAGLARGYVNDEELTARRFPVLGEGEDRRRWYRSGDLVSAGAGSVLRYHGRIDGQVKVRGFRVEPAEIETAIRAVPGVEEAAVFPVRDRADRVTGLVAVAKSAAAGVTEAAITARIGRVLPWYAVPDTVRVLPELPLAVSGKLDRKAIERRLPELVPNASPGPDPIPGPGTAPSRPPDQSHEQIVAGIWSSVLGVDKEFGDDERFFDAGGNSAMLGSVLTRLITAFPEANLQLIDLYRHPTISAMAARLRASAPPRPAAGGTARPRAGLSAADRRRLARRAK
jgi:amino acid adenylation domain-containing protein